MLTGPDESTGGRRDKNRRRLTQRLLDAVERTLEQTGETYAELSVERLLEASGVARSTFYYHFKDKHALVAALAEDVLVEFEREALAWWAVPPSRSSLERATGSMFAVYWQHRVVLAAATEIAATDATVREQLDKLWGQIRAAVTGMIENGQRDNQIRSDLDPRQTTEWLVWMTERGLYQLSRRSGRDELDAYTRTHVDIVWATLAPPDRRGP